MENTKLIIFDWDGTVMDSVPKNVNTVKLVASKHGIKSPSEKAIRCIIGLSLEVAIDILFDETDLTPILAASYKDIYKNHDATPAHLFPHVEQSLKALVSKGYKLAVATGKSRVGLNRLMAESNLENMFCSTRTACECDSKPSPQMILEICDELDIAPQQTVMVGDTSMDLEMAANANVRSVGVSFGAHTVNQLVQHKPEVIIDQFEQIVDLF